MADTVTTNLDMIKPEPGASNDTWGVKINDDLDIIDTAIGDLQGVAGGLEDDVTALQTDKADKATTYTKAETNTLLDAKAPQATTYTKTEVDALVAAAVAAGTRIGQSIEWNSNNIPSGFVKENGAAYSRTTYATLFAEIGTTFGAGDGSTTFNVPDSRGTVTRTVDDGRGLDTGRALGSYQADAMQGHRHVISPPYWPQSGGGAGMSGSTFSASGTSTGNPTTDGVNGTPRTAAETRVKSIAKFKLIRAF
jgi:microcystin-dependent protein